MSSDFIVEAIFPNTAAGGQQVGVPNYPIKVTHVPTGIYAVCFAERSQHRNRTVAMRMVEYGLAEMGWTNTPTAKE